MYTLRLILKGVIFLMMVKTPSGKDQLWLLFLDPGYKGQEHHQARLHVDTGFKDASSRAADGTADSMSYFDLAGEHLTLSFAKPPQPASLFFLRDTRPEGQRKPCFDCGSPYSLQQQKDDFRWVNSLSEILATVPRKDHHTLEAATELREDILDDSYDADGLILARMAIDQGQIRTYTLWGEEGRTFNLDSKLISTFAFPDPSFACTEGVDSQTAVAETVVIELAVSDAFTFSSRSLKDERKVEKGKIVLKGGAGKLVEVQLSSMRPNHDVEEGDFDVFYDLLKHPEYLQFRPLPRPCIGTDSGGACSPVRP